MKYLRLLLFPFSLLYGLVVMVRNWCYDGGIFKTIVFDIPVISVGNLAVGGSGKTPMTEYLVALLKQNYRVATLSRGYGRKTKGFLIADLTSPASAVGDEPSQLKAKYKDITVAVCENRVEGIARIWANNDVIILDDAYQHRAVKPGFSVLLFDYNNLNEPALLLPAGNRREPFSGRRRADVMIVSKCPAELLADDLQRITNNLKLFPWQQVFFTAINYHALTNMAGKAESTNIDPDAQVFLITGIAKSEPLVTYINKQSTKQLVHYNYPDHHRFTLKNIAKLADDYHACASPKKIIITTAKDAQRLGEQELRPLVEKLPIWILPIGIAFLNKGEQQFNQLIYNYVRKH